MKLQLLTVQFDTIIIYIFMYIFLFLLLNILFHLETFALHKQNGLRTMFVVFFLD